MATHSEVLRRRQHDLEEFGHALVGLLEVTEPQPTLSSYARCGPIAGEEVEATRRAAVVDRLSGCAALALESVGIGIDYKPPGVMPGQTQRVNPAAAWRTIIDGYPMFPPQMILACCDQAIGLLDACAFEAEAHERTFEGRLSHALGFWHRVRAENGNADARGIGFVASVLGIPSALTVALITAYLTHWFGWGG